MKASAIWRSSEENSLAGAGWLRLGALLGLEQPVAIARQRPQLGERWGRNRERPPMSVLVAERVGEHERVEPIVFDWCDPVALARPR
jgi:hypothetical protein